MIVTYGGGHVNLMVPVIKTLQQEGKIELVIMGLSVAGDILRSHNIPFKTYTDYKEVIFDEDAKKFGKELADLWHVDGKGISRIDSEVYLGCAMRDLVLEHGEEKAREMLAKGRGCFLQVNTMKKIIELEKPDLMLTGNVPRSERAATIAARNMGIPTINCSDYFEFENRDPLEADKIAVMCGITKENLIKKGVLEDRIVITGQPAFDNISSYNKGLSKEDICEKLNIPADQTYMVLGTQPIPTCEQMIRTTFEAVKKIPNLKLIVKPHPGEDVKMHQALIEEYKIDAILITDPVIRDIIQVSEALITFFSTIAFETVLLGKPLVTLNLTGEPDPIPLCDFGVGLGLHSEEELLPALQKILEDRSLIEKFNKARDKHFSMIINGEGTDRVVKLINEMLP